MADDLDPRFDPEFQRGYDPAVHGRPRPRLRPKVQIAPSPAVVPPHEIQDDAGQIEADVEAPPVLSRNPFVVALPITGVALLGTCAFLMVRWTGAYGRIFDGPGEADDQDWMTAASAVSPALLVGGLLCFTLWLTILALVPRRVDA